MPSDRTDRSVPSYHSERKAGAGAPCGLGKSHADRQGQREVGPETERTPLKRGGTPLRACGKTGKRLPAFWHRVSAVILHRGQASDRGHLVFALAKTSATELFYFEFGQPPEPPPPLEERVRWII